MASQTTLRYVLVSCQSQSVDLFSVYYRVYDEEGEIASKMFSDKTDTSLGRINMLFFPPPHNGASLKVRLNQVEKISPRDLKIFKDDSGENTLKDNDVFDRNTTLGLLSLHHLRSHLNQFATWRHSLQTQIQSK
jgi:hypothetical protein